MSEVLDNDGYTVKDVKDFYCKDYPDLSPLEERILMFVHTKYTCATGVWCESELSDWADFIDSEKQKSELEGFMIGKGYHRDEVGLWYRDNPDGGWSSMGDKPAIIWLEKVRTKALKQTKEVTAALTNKQTHNLVISSMSPSYCKDCGSSGGELHRNPCKEQTTAKKGRE